MEHPSLLPLEYFCSGLFWQTDSDCDHHFLNTLLNPHYSSYLYVFFPRSFLFSFPFSFFPFLFPFFSFLSFSFSSPFLNKVQETQFSIIWILHQLHQLNGPLMTQACKQQHHERLLHEVQVKYNKLK